MASALRARSSFAAPSIAIFLSLATTALPGRADAPKANATAAATASADAAKDKRDRQARAVALHDEAKDLYDQGLYRRAITKLEAALALNPEGKELVYNLALIHEKLAEADIAEAYYLRYIDMETDPKAREHAQGIVKRLQGAKQKIKADLEERAAAAASASASASVSAPASASASATPARTPSPMVFVIGGVAVAALGVGVGFGVSALSTQPVDPTTGPRVTAYDLEMRADSAHKQAIIADLAFGTSVVLAAGATLLYFLESRHPKPTPAAQAGPSQASGDPTSLTRAATLAAPSPQAFSRIRVEAPF